MSLSYYTGNRDSKDNSSFYSTPGDLPSSETGKKTLEVLETASQIFLMLILFTSKRGIRISFIGYT